MSNNHSDIARAGASDHEVIIVGGGPVGCTMSIALSNLGIGNIVLERDPQLHPLPRAILMDAENHRSLINLGLGPQLEPLLTPMRVAEYVDTNGHRLSGIDLHDKTTLGVAPSSVHFQPDLEAMLRHELAARGATLYSACTVVGVSIGEGEYPVQATTEDGTVLRCKWLVACDGASSTVRRIFGIPRIDLGFEQDWLVVDVEVHDRATCGLPDVAWQVCDPARPTTMISGHGRMYRWEFQLQPGENPAEMNEPDNVWGLVSRWITPDKARLVRSAAYKFHALVAENLRHDRVFLVGDSAHQMPPFMGQGLNSGTRDALNLAWKLAWVAQGWADERFLDTYSVERIEHVREVVEASVEAGMLIDQYAGRASHGITPRQGYGGARQRTRFSDGFIAGDHRRIGTVYDYWDELVSVYPAPAEMTLVSSVNTEVDLPSTGFGWSKMRVPRDKALDHDHVVVRPDGYIAAVCSNADLPAVLDELVGRLR